MRMPDDDVPIHGAAEEPTPKLRLVRMSEVKAQKVEWLWEPYIAIGKLTLCEGHPGAGKTWFTLAATAAVTRGWPLPGEFDLDHFERKPAPVFFMTCEDGLADTIRPRLDTAKADCELVYCEDGALDAEGKVRSFHLADLELLEHRVIELRPALVIIDPIQGYLGSGVDMHRANEVRPLLTALGDLADRYRFAAVLIRHLRKSSADHALSRGLGSIDFAAASRSVLVVGENPADSAQRVIAQTKNSLAPIGESMAFRLDHGEFTWDGASELTGDDILAPKEAPRPRSEAADWLQGILAHGPVAVATLKDQASGGFSWRTVETAKKDLGVISRKTGLEGGWVWELPKPEDRRRPQDAHVEGSCGLRDEEPDTGVSASNPEPSCGLRKDEADSDEEPPAALGRWRI